MKENNLVLLQSMGNWHLKLIFLNKLMLLIIFETLCPMHSLARIRCLYHPSTLYSAGSKKKSDQEHEEGLSRHGHAILLITVENNRRQNQNHSSKYFFLISQKMFLENHGSWLLMRSQFTRKKNKQFQISRGKTQPNH